MPRFPALFLAIALAVGAAFPAYAEFRLDLGIIVPRGAGGTSGGESEAGFSGFGFGAQNWPIIPLPEAAIQYQFDLGGIKLGAGGRVFTLLVATLLWPNLFAEIELGRVAIQAQLGGGAFAALTVAGNQSAFARVLVPDISVWYELGEKKTFRFGGGLIGAWARDIEYLEEGFVFMVYLGAKASLPL